MYSAEDCREDYPCEPCWPTTYSILFWTLLSELNELNYLSLLWGWN